MRITITRDEKTPQGTPGRLFIDGDFFCYTLEPPPMGGHPCIPEGSYQATMYPSARFRRKLPLILDVPGRSGILIHQGNTIEDTSGCILVGMRAQAKGYALASSLNTLNNLLSLISLAEYDTFNVDIV